MRSVTSLTFVALRCAAINFRMMSDTSNIVKTYDLVVIGGGSGGLACAKEAASLGKDVAVLDFVTSSPRGTTWGLGGTCVNVGCIPKKLMHHISQMKDILQGAPGAGWDKAVNNTNVVIDWPTMAMRVQNYVKSLNWGHRVALRENNVTYINAKASFVDSKTIKTVDSKGAENVLKAKYFVIAVGGRPKYPEIPGAKEYGITSDDLFWLKKSPGKTLIIGGSYVALECAGFLNAFGCDTTVMVRSIPLRGFDRQMSEIVTEYMANDKNIKFIYGFEPNRVVKEGERYRVYWGDQKDKPQSEVFDTVMFAIGRSPCTDDLNLNAAKVEINSISRKIVSHGKGKNSEVERTSAPNIFAIGDVLENGVELTPVAIKAGKLLARRLFGDSKDQMDYSLVPTTIFTPLEYACVGLSEEDAIKSGENSIEVYHCYYKPLEFVSLGLQQPCYMKLICDLKQNEKVIGLHIVGINAGEIMQGFAVAIKLGVTVNQITNSVGIHPTSAEEVVKLHITKRSGRDPHLTGC